MRNENGADHQREDEEDQADHAAPPVAYAGRNEHEAQEQDCKEIHPNALAVAESADSDS